MTGDLLPEPEPDDEGGIRRPVAEWSDRYARAMLRLARHRLDEFTVPLDPAQARSWAAVLAIMRAVADELQSRADLYAEVDRTLTGADCPCCHRPLEGGDDATP